MEKNKGRGMAGKWVVLTGATSGIGYELAKLFALDGYDLVLIARNGERLNEVARELEQAYEVSALPFPADLFQPGAAEKIYGFTQANDISAYVLVNDAGQGEWGPFTETDLQREIDIIQLNIVALVSLTKYFLKDMVRRNEGRILQVGSEAGTTPMPLLAVYAATKAFVLSFSAALTDELKDTNITITALLPGATDTDFFHKAQAENVVVYQEKYLLRPEEVAKDAYDALMKGESKIISGGRTKMHVMMADMLGAKLSAKKMHKDMEPSDKKGDRKDISHEASMREREMINRATGEKDGDLPS